MLHSLKHLCKHYRATGQILKRILKEPISPEQGEEILARRLRRREESFLEVMEEAVFAYPRSPYKALLDRAGYDFGKVRQLVGAQGVESALEHLHQQGVYVDILEFKGKVTAVRGEQTFTFRESDFSNPLLVGGLETKSGATRSAGTDIVVPLDYIEQHNPYGAVGAKECGMLEKPSVIWLPILPAGEGLFFCLRFAAMGNPPVKWYSQVDERYIRPGVVDKVKTKTTIWMARRYGKKMPAPEFVDMRDTGRIARWMGQRAQRSNGFSVVTYASSALRLVMEARKANLRLGETVFWLMGEPLTDKIRAEIQDYGCRAYSLYGCNELMIIGQGCARASQSDDMHLCNDKLAVIQTRRKVAHSDVEVDAFLFTTLLRTSPKIFVNTETGDYGVIEKRSCGCTFDRLGFGYHIHSVRSFEKLTAEGATFIGSDLIPLVQTVLPGELGGDATDYQFVERPDAEGVPRLYMLISPDIGAVDEKRVEELVFGALTAGEYSHDYGRSYWTQAGTLRIQRQHPIPTKRGKIMPLLIRND